MCRWKNNLTHRFDSTAFALLALLLAWGSSGPAVSAEEVDVWLERRGFTHLLVEHLEGQLESMDPQKRGPVLIRLARLYPELLADANDRAARMVLEERARRLLEDVRGADSHALELELYNGAYLAIEQSAERHRLRLLGDLEKASLIGDIEDLIDNLRKLGVRVDKLIEYSGKGLERAASRIHEGRTKQAVLLAMSHRIDYLLGWCLYYQGWLTDEVKKAEQAERYFATVLGLDELSPDEVSMDLRSNELIGWSIIGMALVNQMVASETSAIDWLELLDEPIVPEAMRSRIAEYQLIILLEGRRFKEAMAFLEKSSRKPVLWLRMASVQALEAEGEPEARELASMSLAELASLGALDQLQDIVSRYSDSISGDSFPFAYARAVLDHREARDMQDASDVDEMTRREAWMNARRSVQRALQSDDVDRFDQARQQARLLHALSLYRLDQFEEASEIFESVSQFLPERESAEALWMAFRSEDRRLNLDPDLSRERADGLIASYLRRFPEGQHAGELKVIVAASESDPSDQLVEELLEVPADSPARRNAESQAAVMLYRLFEAAPGYRKKERASRFLSVAIPIMQANHASDDEKRISKGVELALLVLKVATDDDVRRLVAADGAIEILGSERSRLLPKWDSVLDEVEYRTILIMIERDRLEDAMAAADLLHDRAPESVWSGLADNRILLASERAIGISDQKASAVPHRSMVKLGLRLLSGKGSFEEASEDPSSRLVASKVGSSAVALSMMPEVPEEERARMTDLAWSLYERLLAAEPRNTSYLAARARLASLKGDNEESLRCWRIIAAGSPAGSDQWFEARTELLLMLEQVDPERASKVLSQHVILYPEYGPDPWGEVLRSLAQRLPLVGDGGAP